MQAHSFLSVSEEGLFVWIAVEGGAIYYTFQFDTHTTLRNKDLSEIKKYSSIPESSDRMTWIPG